MQSFFDKYKVLLIYVLLAGGTFWLYKSVCNYPFIPLDDMNYITANPNIAEGFTAKAVKWAFVTDLCTNWHPITWLSHIMDVELFGFNAGYHHFINLLIHIGNVLLLFAILKAMTGKVWQSAFVAAVFAVHPLNVESVAWVSERKNVLSTLFWLLVMAGYWRYAKNKSTWWYAVTLLLFAMGLMSKPMLVTLPFVLLLMDYWPLERIVNFKDRKIIVKLIVEKVPFIVLSIISSVITFVVQQREAMGDFEDYPVSARLINGVISYSRYITKMVWPERLGILYPFDSSVSVNQVVLPTLFLALILIFAICMSSKHRFLIVGWLWYLGTLVPVIGIVQVGIQSHADRYAYIPLI
jgi:hypothetical protein